ncbi:MAG: hypothetical protein AB3K77_11040 [Methanosarcinaceae archaeon]
MKKEMENTSHKPILHGFLLSNGSFVTPAEMKFLQNFLGSQTAEN